MVLADEREKSSSARAVVVRCRRATSWSKKKREKMRFLVAKTVLYRKTLTDHRPWWLGAAEVPCSQQRA
jgi:hypothetical protein